MEDFIIGLVAFLILFTILLELWWVGIKVFICFAVALIVSNLAAIRRSIDRVEF